MDHGCCINTTIQFNALLISYIVYMIVVSEPELMIHIVYCNNFQ